MIIMSAGHAMGGMTMAMLRLSIFAFTFFDELAVPLHSHARLWVARNLHQPLSCTRRTNVGDDLRWIRSRELVDNFLQEPVTKERIDALKADHMFLPFVEPIFIVTTLLVLQLHLLQELVLLDE